MDHVLKLLILPILNMNFKLKRLSNSWQNQSISKQNSYKGVVMFGEGGWVGGIIVWRGRVGG